MTIEVRLITGSMIPIDDLEFREWILELNAAETYIVSRILANRNARRRGIIRPRWAM